MFATCFVPVLRVWFNEKIRTFISSFFGTTRHISTKDYVTGDLLDTVIHMRYLSRACCLKAVAGLVLATHACVTSIHCRVRRDIHKHADIIYDQHTECIADES